MPGSCHGSFRLPPLPVRQDDVDLLRRMTMVGIPRVRGEKTHADRDVAPDLQPLRTDDRRVGMAASGTPRRVPQRRAAPSSSSCGSMAAKASASAVHGARLGHHTCSSAVARWRQTGSRAAPGRSPAWQASAAPRISAPKPHAPAHRHRNHGGSLLRPRSGTTGDRGSGATSSLGTLLRGRQFWHRNSAQSRHAVCSAGGFRLTAPDGHVAARADGQRIMPPIGIRPVTLNRVLPGEPDTLTISRVSAAPRDAPGRNHHESRRLPRRKDRRRHTP